MAPRRSLRFITSPQPQPGPAVYATRVGPPPPLPHLPTSSRAARRASEAHSKENAVRHPGRRNAQAPATNSTAPVTCPAMRSRAGAFRLAEMGKRGKLPPPQVIHRPPTPGASRAQVSFAAFVAFASRVRSHHSPWGPDIMSNQSYAA